MRSFPVNQLSRLLRLALPALALLVAHPAWARPGTHVTVGPAPTPTATAPITHVPPRPCGKICGLRTVVAEAKWTAPTGNEVVPYFATLVATAECPSNTIAIGGGTNVFGEVHGVRLVSSGPFFDDNGEVMIGWRGTTSVDGQYYDLTTYDDYEIEVWAICATVQ